MKTAILVIMAAAAAGAQERPDVRSMLKENAEALKSYTYKRRTDITVKDKTATRVDLIRHVDGTMETIPLESPQRLQNQGGRGSGGGRGLRGRMMEKKKQEMKEEMEHMKALLERYSPGSDGMKDALAKATISRVGSDANADIQIVAKGISKPSDSFTLVWSAAHRRPVRSEIRADLDGKPATITMEYAGLPDGPFYAARTLISAPKKNLKVTIDTYDYNASQASQ